MSRSQRVNWNESDAELLRLLVDNVTDYAIFVLDVEGHVTTWNPGARRIKGYEGEEIIGQHFSIFYPQEALDRDWPSYELKVAAAERRFEDEGWRVRKDGSQFWANVVITALRNEQGSLRGYAKITRDLTARKHAEESARRLAEESAARHAIHDERERLQVTLASIGDAVITTDAEGRITFLNQVAEQLVGWKTVEATGRPLEEVFHIVNENTRQSVDNPAIRALREGRIVGLANHTILIARDGMEHPIDDSAAPICNNRGEVSGSVLVFRDISERRRDEAAVRKSEARFRGLIEQSPFSVQVFSPEGRTILVNRAWEDLWGFSLAQLEGYNVLQDKQLAEKGVLPFIQKAFAGEPTHVPAIKYDPNETIPGQTKHKDPVRWVAAVAYPLIDDQGTVQEVVIVHDDITERRKVEDALRESEEKLRLLADTIPQLAWMAKPDGHIFWYNRRWYEYTGRTLEQMEGWGWQSVHDPEVLPQVLERWKSSLESGEPFNMVFPLRGADGVMRPFLTRVNPLRDDVGRILYWFGTNTDITELRLAREALAASEERLQLALNAGRMGVWDWNVQTGELQWSDSLEPLHGLAPGTFGGSFEHFQQLIHPDDREAVHFAIQQALATGEEFYVEFRNLQPNGAIHWIAGSGKVFYDQDGQPIRMLGIGLDVTRRKRSEQTAKFLADASAELAVLVDFDSTLQKITSLAVPHFADWAAVDVLEASGLRRVAVAHVDPEKVQFAHELHRRFPPDPAAPNGVWNILRTGQAELISEIDEEMLRRSTQGELLEIILELGLKSYIGVPLTVRGNVMAVLTFVIAESNHSYDATDLAVAMDLANRTAIAVENTQLYRELREADRCKDEFLATLAHELRNPLAPIRNGLQVMQLAGNLDGMLDDVRNMMERQLTHLVRLVDDLLDVSRITRNKLELRKERVQLASVIHTAIETSRPQIEQHGHTFSLTLTSVPVSVEADPVRLAQVFSNLINNAAKYTDPGGHIAVMADIDADEAVVRVRDNGLGIPMEAQAHIFEMFSQVDRSIERAQSGLGIGLTLVRRLTELHGGTVDVASAGPGKGSEFIVRIPLLREIHQRAVEPAPRPVGHGPKRRILVVDDNRDAAESLGMMLQLMGNEVRTVTDGLTAVETAQQYRPEMILLDIGLPKLNGYEVCRRIREQVWSTNSVIVALTGWGQDEDRRRSFEAGFDHHLVKPVNVTDLTKLLAQIR